MLEYPIARMFASARVQRIYGGTNEIMKELHCEVALTADYIGTPITKTGRALPRLGGLALAYWTPG